MKNMLSVIIPSRNDEFLQKTIDDLLLKARGEIEIIVVLDGYWPDPMIKDDDRVLVIHQGTIFDNFGMREAINAGVAAARGEYIMKIDEHCMVDEGFDEKLKADCEDDWVVIPRRYRLDAENWKIIEDGRPPIDYMYLTYPFEREFDDQLGLHGKEWKRLERENILIDETMSWQGSCYFMKKSYWVPMDTEKYGPFTQEAQEIGNRVWLSGGKLMVNKKTWYAHYHKGKRGKGYGFNNKQYEKFMADKEQGRQFSIEYWLTTKDYKYDFQFLLDRFKPVPGWPDNWREIFEVEKKKDFAHSPNHRTFKAS